MSVLDDLKGREKAALDLLGGVRKEIREYWLNKHKEDFGVSPGVIVELKDGKMAMIDSVDAREAYNRRPWVKGYVQKKDGNYGKALRNLYSDWKVIVE